MPWRPLPALRYALRGIAFMLEERNARLLLAAGAVLMAALAAVSIGLVVFVPRLF